MQPHVWAELKRSGLGSSQAPPPQRAFWWAGGERHEGSPDELIGLLDPGNEAPLAETRTWFPQPYAPLEHPDLATVDGVTIRQRIDALDLPDQRELFAAFWTLNFNSTPRPPGPQAGGRWPIERAPGGAMPGRENEFETSIPSGTSGSLTAGQRMAQFAHADALCSRFARLRALWDVNPVEVRVLFGALEKTPQMRGFFV
jgi:hypothetical protein